MTQAEKSKTIVFAREAFKHFYAENRLFLEDDNYKPGKKMYRNMTSLNKMMAAFLESSEDYIIKKDLVNTKWPGPSSYVQHERVITNFGLSDTTWKDRNRSVLLLSDSGKKLREQYRRFHNSNPTIDLYEYTELPTFARTYLIKEIKNTTSKNMTLWKNVLLTGLYVYVVLGRIPIYSHNCQVSEEEKEAFLTCCNYQKNGVLMDVSYFSQPAAMLRNLKLLNKKGEMTADGYRLINDLQIFKEINASIHDYEDYFGKGITAVEDIFSSKATLEKVDAPQRKQRKAKKKTDLENQVGKNIDFVISNKKHQKTGELGERLVYNYEKERLKKAGIEDVDEKVILTSESDAYSNTYPCDILSVDISTGKRIYIEVKTTTGNAETPFYISESERAFSEKHADDYYLYRVFDVIKTREPKYYETHGYIGDNFTLICDSYLVTR